MSFENYRNRVLRKGSNSQEIILSDIEKGFEDFLKFAPNSFTTLINDAEEHLVAIQDKTITKDFTTEKYLLACLGSPIGVGDIFSWSEYYWIVTYEESKTINSHQRYIIARCNNTLTFQTPDTTIHRIPCIITDRASVYSDGVEDTKYIRLPDGLIKIVIPNNELTNTFDLLNKRIVFDHSKYSVFEVTKADKLLKKGLIEIIAEVQTYDPNKDNLELNLSSYVDTTEPETPEIPPEIPDERNYEVILYGQDIITLMQTGNYSVRTFDNGIETSHEVRFEIDNTSLANIKSQDGRNCVVATNTNFSMGEVKLKVILLVDEAVFVEKTIGITGF